MNVVFTSKHNVLIYLIENVDSILVFIDTQCTHIPNIERKQNIIAL